MRRLGNPSNWQLVDKYDSSYWSGGHVDVYANDVLLDSVQVSYQIVERVHPYYGYASYVADRMHHGTRLVTGELTLNFKRYNYLFSLLSYLRQGKGRDLLPVPKEISVPRTDEERNADGSTGLVKVRPPVPYESDATPISQSKASTLSATQLRRLLNARKKAHDEDQYLVNTDIGQDVYPSNVQTTLGMFATRPSGFELNIIHGAGLVSAQTLRFHTEDDYSLKMGSTHDIQYTPNPGTGLKILGVELQGDAKVIDDSGRPVLETYTFQARDVVPMSPTQLVKMQHA